MSIAIGIGLNAAGEQAKPLLHVIQAMYAVVEKIMFAMFWLELIPKFDEFNAFSFRLFSTMHICVEF